MPGFSPRAVGVLQLPAAFELGCQALAAAVWGLWLTVSPLLELCRERGGGCLSRTLLSVLVPELSQNLG